MLLSLGLRRGPDWRQTWGAGLEHWTERGGEALESLSCGGRLGEEMLWEEPGPFSGLCLTRVTCAPSPRPSILAHQVPNAKKLKRKEQLWEKLAKQGELPREVRRAQARLRNPPAARVKPGPQDTIERPFYDLWAKDSEYPCYRFLSGDWAAMHCCAGCALHHSIVSK